MTALLIQQIMSAGFNLKAPFKFDLDKNQHLLVEEVLRVMPGKRVVVRATEHNKAMLAKIFFQTRNFQHEVSCYQELRKTGVATPELLSQQTLNKGGVCIYKYIENAHPFEQRWQAANETEKQQLLNQLLPLLQQLYNGGLHQTDLHLGNFIFSNKTLYALDPAGCEKLNNSDGVLKNLALLLAQFPFPDWSLVGTTITLQFSGIDKIQLMERALAERKKRTEHFLQKIYRESTYIQHWSAPKGNLQIYCVREQNSPDVQKLLETIDVLPKNVDTLKHGNSSVVSRLEINGKKIAIKHSRNKNIWRLLRRCFRRSRASNSWHFTHLLRDAGVNAPAPLALVERKLGPLVLESWFVSECIEGDNLLDVWLYQEPSPQELSAVSELFVTMRKLRISHGDMKATNLLLADDKLYVIDFDGMKEYKSANRAEWALQKDRERLIDNWKSTTLATKLREQIF